jgi:putative membrane protein insertion efficiency factor
MSVATDALLRRLHRLPADGLIALVRAYRFFLSPWLGSSCRFEPTCSRYALEALERHGAATGSYLTLRRLARCHPWCDGGHDPVPDAPAGLFAALRLPFIDKNAP